VYVVAAVALVLPASVLLWLVVERTLGALAAVVAVLAAFTSPFGVGAVVERLATAMNASVRAERVAGVLIPIVSLVGLVMSVTTHRSLTASTLVDVPERHPWAGGAVGDALRSVGRALGGGRAESPAPPPATAPPEASSRPPARDAATRPSEDLYQSGDGTYRDEPSCRDLADVSAIERSYKPGKRRDALYALAKARYPTGLPFLEAQRDTELDAWFTGAADSFAGVAKRFDTAVHEGSHIWSFRRFSPATQTYPVDAESTLRAKRLRNFPRSEILDLHVDPAADSYAKTYLEGDSGKQGFNSLLDEYNAYAHSLASRYCTRDFVQANARVTARDGVLTFMYYVEVYLQLARTRHAADYRSILADEGHRRVIVTVWDRAELWLRRSASDPRLGVADATIRDWVYAPERLEEIARVREHEEKK
jgi:hypothetical protein